MVTHAAPVLGVSIDGYAVEGGYDVEGAPDTSYGVEQALGRVRASTRTPSVFDHLDELVEVAAGLGFGELRLTCEWARLEPRPGVRDLDALARYERAMRAAASAKMTCTVVLCDSAWPSWLGREPWLSSWAPPRFEDHARWVAASVEGLARAIVTFRSPNAAARGGWQLGTRPPFRRRADEDATAALDGMLVAHQLATTAIAQVAPSLTRAIIFEAGQSYDYEGLWRDVRSGLTDPVLLGARRDRFERELVSARSRQGPLPRARREAVGALRSSRGWEGSAPSEWWLAGDDPDLLAATLRHAEAAVPTVELGAGEFGWDAQLAVGIPTVTEPPFGATTVHAWGLVGSTGPLDGPVGLLDVDQRGGGWSAQDRRGRVASALAALGR